MQALLQDFLLCDPKRLQLPHFIFLGMFSPWEGILLRLGLPRLAWKSGGPITTEVGSTSGCANGIMAPE